MNVTARFCEEGSTSTVKTLSQIVGGGKGTLTAALETFQKESNDYLTQCIEKSSKLSSDGGVHGDKDANTEEEEDDEDSSNESPPKVMKLT